MASLPTWKLLRRRWRGIAPGRNATELGRDLAPVVARGSTAWPGVSVWGSPGIFGRIDRDRLLLDLRTVLPEEDEVLSRSLRRSLGGR